MNEIFVSSLTVLLVLGCAFSLAMVRRDIKLLLEQIRPIGWKELLYGPRLGNEVSEVLAGRLGLAGNLSLVLFLDRSCYECGLLARGIPALADLYPQISIVVLSVEEFSSYRKLEKKGRVRYVVNADLIGGMNLSVAPYALVFQGKVPLKKGIVNSLEQMQMLIDPGYAEKIG